MFPTTYCYLLGARTKLRRVQNSTYDQPIKVRIMGYVVGCSEDSSNNHRNLSNIIDTAFHDDGTVDDPVALKKALISVSNEQKSITSSLNRLVSESALGACDIQENDSKSFTLPDVNNVEDKTDCAL